MMRKVCTYCGQEGHRAHRCPSRQHILPLRVSDLYWCTLLVALIAGVSVYA